MWDFRNWTKIPVTGLLVLAAAAFFLSKIPSRICVSLIIHGDVGLL